MDISYKFFDGRLVIDNWRIFVLTGSFVVFLAAFLVYFMDESPKFLMAVGRNDEALNVFRKIYSQNTGNSPESYPVSNIHACSCSHYFYTTIVRNVFCWACLIIEFFTGEGFEIRNIGRAEFKTNAVRVRHGLYEKRMDPNKATVHVPLSDSVFLNIHAVVLVNDDVSFWIHFQLNEWDFFSFLIDIILNIPVVNATGRVTRRQKRVFRVQHLCLLIYTSATHQYF